MLMSDAHSGKLYQLNFNHYLLEILVNMISIALPRKSKDYSLIPQKLLLKNLPLSLRRPNGQNPGSACNVVKPRGNIILRED